MTKGRTTNGKIGISAPSQKDGKEGSTHDNLQTAFRAMPSSRPLITRTERHHQVVRMTFLSQIPAVFRGAITTMGDPYGAQIQPNRQA